MIVARFGANNNDTGVAMFLDYFALGLLFFVGIVLFYGIIAIHDIPYEISKRRDHPHQDAIHVAGWVSLFTLHVLWPFLWIWATLYREDRGWGFSGSKSGTATTMLERKVAELSERLEAIEGEGVIVGSVKTRPNTASFSTARPVSPANYSSSSPDKPKNEGNR